MKPIIILIMLALGMSCASAQYLPIMGPNGPVDIYVAKPTPADTLAERALADNPEFACPIRVSCTEERSEPDKAGDIIIEMDVKTTSR